MAEILHLTHEVGDLSEYNSTTTDGGDLSVTAAAALIGSFGLSFLIDDTNLLQAVKTFTQLTSTVYRYRIYIDPNGLTIGTGDFFRCLMVRKAGNSRSQVNLEFDGTDYRIRARVTLDSGNVFTAYYVITDASHFIEVLVRYATSAVASDGETKLFIDGVLKETISNLDIFDVTKPDRIIPIASAVDAGTSGTYYIDDIILRDDDTEIGPEPSGTVHPLYYNRRHHG